MISLRAAFVLPLALLAAPALAQEDTAAALATADAPPPPATTATIGGGLALVPDYEGSDDYMLIPAAQGIANFDGLKVFTRGAAVYVDLIRDDRASDVDVELGPLVAGRFGRTRLSLIDDAPVRALGELDTAIEVGAFAGISKTGLITSDFDVATARINYQRDVAGAHDSWVMSPMVSYMTPLSTRNLVGLSASMDFVGDRYADYYFGVSPAGSVASGFAPYDPDGGLKSYSLTLMGAQSLEGDIRSGFVVVGAVSYTRLVGDFADSPIVAVTGSPTQWLAALGIGYTF